MAMQQHYDPHRHIRLISRADLPKVEVLPSGSLECDGRGAGPEETSGDLRKIAYAWLALAEHQEQAERKLFNDKDRIARDLYERGWIHLPEEHRTIVTRVYEQYTRKQAAWE